jgi:capsular polysaccharide biosynthesis protein
MPMENTTPDDVQELIARYRNELGSWGKLPAAMRLKRALVRRLGLDAAFAVVARELAVPDTGLLRRREVGLLHDHAQRSPSFKLLNAGGERFQQPEPETIGAGIRGPMWGRTRAAWLACFDEATLRGRSNLLQVGDKILVDREQYEGAIFEDNPEYDPGVLYAEHDALWLMEPPSPSMRLDEAFMLSGSHSIDFGHWVTECLPRLGMALAAGWRGGMPVLVDERIPKTMKAALPDLLPANSPLVAIPHLSTVHVKRLWTVPNPMFVGFYPTQFFMETWDQMAAHPASFSRWMDALMARVEPAQDSGADRVYLARKPGRKKALRNYAQIEEVVAHAGFSKVYPEDLSFAEQIRLVRSARFIVAPEGSNNLLALFATAGTRLCTLNPPYTHPLTDLNGLLSHRGVEMQVFTGEAHPTEEFSPFWWDYTIDPVAFAAHLDRWLHVN